MNRWTWKFCARTKKWVIFDSELKREINEGNFASYVAFWKAELRENFFEWPGLWNEKRAKGFKINYGIN